MLPLNAITDIGEKAIGAAQDAARMERVVNFYARLPRGAAPEVKPTGLIGRYQARYFSGKNASAARKSLEYFDIMCVWLADWSNSPCPRHRWYPDHRIQHGVLLPPPYVAPLTCYSDIIWSSC